MAKHTWADYVAMVDRGDLEGALAHVQDRIPGLGTELARMPASERERGLRSLAKTVQEDLGKGFAKGEAEGAAAERRRIFAILDAPVPGFPGVEALRWQYMRDPNGTVEDFCVAALEKLSAYDAARRRAIGDAEAADGKDGAA